ncbi:glycosyltransferase [Aquirufa sp. OSTEICH-129V]|uniref:Glycosyltransferase n=1 Tax=Aquirufa avitistagni TaxID=3104728 RepID=A0ABW6DEZ4_9BACT
MKHRLLLFDTILDGHHPDYLTHVIGYFSGRMDVDVIVVSGEKFKEDFDSRRMADQLVWGSNVTFVGIPMDQIARLHATNIYRRSFMEWDLMLTYAVTHQATHALLMYFDYFPLAAWLGKRSPIPVSGISFRTDFFEDAPGFYPKLKKWLLARALQSGQIHSLFCLVQSLVPTIRQIAGPARVEPLCDPIKSYVIADEVREALRIKQGIPVGKKVYLNFGFLDDRKGMEVFLDGCKQLPPSEHENMCLVLAGPIAPAYLPRIQAAIAALPSLQVITLFGYLPAQEVQICFELANVVLMLYQGHTGMSSVLVRGAMAEKAMLGTELGMIGDMIRSRGLGKVVDATDALAVGNALRVIQTEGLEVDEVACQQVAAENSLKTFGDTIARCIES